MPFTAISDDAWRGRLAADDHHPDAGHQLLQVVLALVNLSGSATRVRWLAIHQLS